LFIVPLPAIKVVGRSTGKGAFSFLTYCLTGIKDAVDSFNIGCRISKPGRELDFLWSIRRILAAQASCDCRTSLNPESNSKGKSEWLEAIIGL
jgi:hypothetical protein